MRLQRRGRIWLGLAPAAVFLLGACTERRPTAEELTRWEEYADRVVVYSAIWQGLALAALGFLVWIVIRHRQGNPPAWPFSATVLIGVMTGVMQLPTLAFLGLWTS